MNERTPKEILKELWDLGYLGSDMYKSKSDTCKFEVNRALKELIALIPKKRVLKGSLIVDGFNIAIDEIHKRFGDKL